MIKKILVSQPRPTSDKSPYFDIAERFGLVYVDYETQRRIPKDSALWYRHVMETNGAEL